MKTKYLLFSLVVLGVVGMTWLARDGLFAKEEAGAVKWFKFDEDNALSEWTEKIFKGKVYYSVQHQKAEGFVRAMSQNASSGLYYRVRFNPAEYPLVSWKWTVTKFPQIKERPSDAPIVDDFAARMYIIFPSGSFRTSRCLEYVWDEFLPAGTIQDSPWGKNIKLVVIRTGGQKNVWCREERNVYEDFKKAFGYYPKLYVGAVAFMTDTDDTKGTAEAYYDEIKLGYK